MKEIMPKCRLVVLFLCMVISLSSCYRISALPPKFENASQLSREDTAKVLNEIAKKDNGIGSFRGLFNATWTQKGGQNVFRQEVLFQRPALLRLVSYPDTSFYALNLLVVNEDGAVFVDNTERSALRMKDAGKLVKRVLKIPLDPEDLLSLFVGRIPDREAQALLSNSSVEVRRNAQEKIVVIIDRSASITFVLDSESHLLREALYRNIFNDTLSLKVTFDDYREIENVLFVPYAIRFGIPSEKLSLELRLEHVKVNTEIKDPFFHIEIPEGYTVKNN